jgi:hypothetical protein
MHPALRIARALPDDFTHHSEVQNPSLVFEKLDGGPADDEVAALGTPPAVIMVARKGVFGWSLAYWAIVHLMSSWAPVLPFAIDAKSLPIHAP